VTERGTTEQLLDLAFRLYDIDGNGTIEMRELAEILRVSSITGQLNLAQAVLLEYMQNAVA